LLAAAGERQLEGIAKAKAEGVYKGRKPSIDQTQVERHSYTARETSLRASSPRLVIR
jgi:DNA invertase Pin-like site-specific DNA recombinase